MFASLVLAVWAAFDNQIALITWIALSTLLLFIAVKMKKVITIDSRELRIGKAHIELRYLDSVELLTPAQIRLLRTRDANPAAFPALIFWISTGVKITLKDPRDSTPYWLVSSKKAEELTNTLYKLL
jgi:energy-converting hydrogenase Eha subunit E